MKKLGTLLLGLFLFFTNGFSQLKMPVQYRVEKQAMSTPMTNLEDIMFVRPYHAKPVNIDFDGNSLKLYYDNGCSFVEKKVTEVDHQVEYEADKVILETMYFTDNTNCKDTILFVADYEVGYLQVVLPTKDSTGKYVGYTSYKKYIDFEGLALN